MAKSPASQAYKLLGFQYKPLEARIKKIILGRPDGLKAWKQFKSLSPAKKIFILDRVAASLHL